MIPMKILMLNYEFPPLGGGAANANYYLLKEFSKDKDLEIDVITSSVGKFKKSKFSENINLYRLDIGKNKDNLHYQTNKDLLLFSLKALKESIKLNKKNNYDLIHAWFGIPCGFIAMFLHKPFLVALRGSDVPFYNPRFRVADRYFFKYLSRVIWKKSSSVVANSEGLKTLAKETSPKQKIAVIYNGVDTNEFLPVNRKKTGKTLRIILVSRLIKRKGINYLLDALSQIKQENFHLMVIGDGNQREHLEKMAKEAGLVNKVSFLGLVSHKSISQYYSQSDLFILPSLNEGMSNTVLEAMASGLPIITTNVGGSKELIKDNGFVVNPRSSEEILDAIKKYLADPSLLIKHGKESRRIAERMSWENVAKNYKSLYNSLLKKHK